MKIVVVYDSHLGNTEQLAQTTTKAGTRIPSPPALHAFERPQAEKLMLSHCGRVFLHNSKALTGVSFMRVILVTHTRLPIGKLQS